MSDLIPTQPQELVIIDQLPIDQNPAAVYLASLGSNGSRRVQGQALRVIAEILTGNPDPLACAWHALRFQHTQAIRARLAERYAPATANRMLSALRGVLTAARGLGLITADEMAMAASFKGVKGETLLAGRALTSGEIAALMGSCESDSTPAGARDAAMIACLYPAGLRRDEVPALDLADYDPASGALTVQHGKGNKARITYLESGGKAAMGDWLRIRGEQPGALFWPINKAGKITPRRMSNQAVYNALAKRGELAGVANFSPHDLRRTMISDLLDSGADVSTVARLAGHASILTTQGYDRRPEATKAKAMSKLHLPYHGRG